MACNSCGVEGVSGICSMCSGTRGGSDGLYDRWVERQEEINQSATPPLAIDGEHERRFYPHLPPDADLSSDAICRKAQTTMLTTDLHAVVRGYKSAQLIGLGFTQSEALLLVNGGFPAFDETRAAVLLEMLNG